MDTTEAICLLIALLTIELARYCTMTPVEAAAGIPVPAPLRYTEGGDLDLRVAVTRRHVGGDPKLAYPAITVTPKHRSVA
ncbi:MAG: hypothetical protein H6814_08855 [Phycisphaeraceae bacterium]|nr:hypothetical protein [Phycisphaeraceae bacterium]